MSNNDAHIAAAARSFCSPVVAEPQHRAQPSGHYVDVRPIRAHLVRLQRQGMNTHQIAQSCGVTPSTITLIMARRTNQPAGTLPSVLQDVAVRILTAQFSASGRTPASTTKPVPAVGTIRRLQALVAAGYTPGMLSQQLNIALADTYILFSHCDVMAAATARAVAELFDRLEMVPGPSAGARTLGRKLGWAPPLAWDRDDLDDPIARPSLAVDKHASFPERYRELRELGVHDELTIAQRLGMKVDSLQRQLARYREEVVS